jgi:hypothetical protein
MDVVANQNTRLIAPKRAFLSYRNRNNSGARATVLDLHRPSFFIQSDLVARAIPSNWQNVSRYAFPFMSSSHLHSARTEAVAPADQVLLPSYY